MATNGVLYDGLVLLGSGAILSGLAASMAEVLEQVELDDGELALAPVFRPPERR